MNIVGTDYDLNNRALWIFLSGCKEPHCPGCHNPELWEFNQGRRLDKIYEQEIINKINDNDLIERVFIAGGEPLHQNYNELEDFLHTLKLFAIAERWIWTRYEYLPPRIEKLVHYAKFGAYKEELPGYTEDLFGIKLASSNQWIEKIN